MVWLVSQSLNVRRSCTDNTAGRVLKTSILRQAAEKRNSTQMLLVCQRWDKTFGDKATMAKELRCCSFASLLWVGSVPSGRDKSVLDVFICVHKAAGDTATRGGLTLLDLCQRVIIAALNKMKSGEEGGLPRNTDWVLAQLHSGMNDVSTFTESLVYERPTVPRRVLYKVGVVAENSPALFEQLEVTLRGILAGLQSRDALPNLPTIGSAPPISEKRQDSPALPLPWDAYEVAQSLHNSAEQLAQSMVRERSGVQSVFNDTSFTLVCLRKFQRSTSTE